MWIYTVNNITIEEISQLLCVSKSTVYRYLEKFECIGDVRPKSHHHGPNRLLGELEQVLLLRIILSNPGIYLSEVQSMIFSKFGRNISLSTICRTLKYMGCTVQPA